MVQVRLKYPTSVFRLFLSIPLLFTINLPCYVMANGNPQDCCTEGKGCGEKAASEQEAQDCCTQKGLFDTPLFHPNSGSYSLKSPDILAVGFTASEGIPEASPHLYQRLWSQEILKVPLSPVYKLTCTYRI